MAWSTAKEILNDAAVELGLLGADLVDPFASGDQAIVLLCRLLKKSGRDVVREREWSHLTRECTLTTVALQKEYPLPADFRAMVPQSGWNRTGTRELGEMSPQEWQAAKGTANVYTGRVLFRRANAAIWLLEDGLAANLSVAFEYRTTWWASSTGGASPTKEYPTAPSDIVYVDAHLITRKVILDWRAAKRMDTTTAQQDYDDAYSKAAAADGSGRPLSLGGPREGVPLISDANLPDTGYLQ